jgi:uncharacterized protein YndB with AHSA1/START domain
MTVIAVRKDADNLTMTLDAEFDASPERVWQLWSDPRQLERWWGPPSYPATFDAYDFRLGGRAVYHMTGPDGPTPNGFWQIRAIDPPRSLSFQDGFANADGSPNTDMPLSDVKVTIEAVGNGRTRMSIENVFADRAAMEQLLGMGQEEGLTEAVGQIDAILAEDPVAGAPR